MFKRLVVLTATAFILGACSPKEPIQNDPWVDTPSEPVAYETESDTLTYDFLAESEAAADYEVSPEADLPVMEEVAAPVAEAVAALPPAVEVQPIEAPAATGPLFYVQIFASHSRTSAEDFALKADAKLAAPVRILFLEPYYKVLVGGSTERDETVVLRRDLTDMGYQGAWIFEH